MLSKAKADTEKKRQTPGQLARVSHPLNALLPFHLRMCRGRGWAASAGGLSMRTKKVNWTGLVCCRPYLWYGGGWTLGGNAISHLLITWKVLSSPIIFRSIYLKYWSPCQDEQHGPWMLSRRRIVDTEWWEVTFVERVMIKMLIIRWLMYKIGEQKLYAWKSYKNFVKLQRSNCKKWTCRWGTSSMLSWIKVFLWPSFLAASFS